MLCLAEQGKELKDLILYWMPSKAKSGRCSLDVVIAEVETDFISCLYLPDMGGCRDRDEIRAYGIKGSQVELLTGN